MWAGLLKRVRVDVREMMCYIVRLVKSCDGRKGVCDVVGK